MIPLPTNEPSRWKTTSIPLDILHKQPRHKLLAAQKQKLNKMVDNTRPRQNPIDMF
jgi:hypothetical protein